MTQRHKEGRLQSQFVWRDQDQRLAVSNGLFNGSMEQSSQSLIRFEH
ncbi:hypothetical protein RBSWK_00745 [Rhodopirellula baltica SWK14]|uniref:Uncharacterized protein n=1 Tax=Rhodopirellula baltica SWK14 TaxID=993516 RepID=L7CN38_RHOBT|nr:hypothetical protein RBSWK_00745 [Rhodopirellula baltica SWK14]